MYRYITEILVIASLHSKYCLKGNIILQLGHSTKRLVYSVTVQSLYCC